MEYRSADGDQKRFPALAADLVRLNVDVIVGGGTPHALAAQQATSTIPIVVAALVDSFVDGLVASLARPGENITGLTQLGAELVPKRLDLLKEALPGLSRVVVLLHPGASNERTTNEALRAIEITADRLRLRLQIMKAHSPEDIDNIFDRIARERPEALLIAYNSMFLTERRRIVDLAAKHRLPSMFPAREYVDMGGLMSYGTGSAKTLRFSAAYVDKILKGAKPADLPVE